MFPLFKFHKAMNKNYQWLGWLAWYKPDSGVGAMRRPQKKK